jgi:hypothetical protein
MNIVLAAAKCLLSKTIGCISRSELLIPIKVQIFDEAAAAVANAEDDLLLLL